MKAKFIFSLICVAAVTLTACEEYPYGYGGYGYPYGRYGYGGGYGYPYGGYGYPTVAVAIGGNGYYDGYGYGGNRYYGNRSYGGHRRHHYYDRY